MRRRAVASLTLLVAIACTGVHPAAAATGTAVHLQFRPVLTLLPSGSPTPATPAARAAVASCDPAAVAALPTVPTSTNHDPAACVVLPEAPGGPRVERYYLGPSTFSENGVAGARAGFQAGQGWTIRLDLTRAGSTAWDALARAQFHQQVALVADGLVLSAPTIQPADETFASFGGKAVISGTFTARSAGALVAGLRRAIAAGR